MGKPSVTVLSKCANGGYFFGKRRRSERKVRVKMNSMSACRANYCLLLSAVAKCYQMLHEPIGGRKKEVQASSP